MIEVNGLTKRFGEVHALSDVSFSVQKGQIVGFLGANGAGKTTTMDIICGCLGQDQGSVSISGFDILDEPLEAKRRLGYLPDEPPIYLDMRVDEYVRYAAHLNQVPRAQVEQRIDEVCEKLSIGNVRHRLIGNLSKGYRQRVALAQAIVHNPDVLVLDEPTEGLDPNQIVHIRDLIRSLGGDHTIILSSHILSEVQNTCDHIVIIHSGKIIEQGTYEEIIRSKQSGMTYLLQVRQGSSVLAEKLTKLNTVDIARVVPGREETLEISLSSGVETADEIAKLALEAGHGIRELSEHRKSLEDVFFQLTN